MCIQHFICSLANHSITNIDCTFFKLYNKRFDYQSKVTEINRKMYFSLWMKYLNAISWPELNIIVLGVMTVYIQNMQEWNNSGHFFLITIVSRWQVRLAARRSCCCFIVRTAGDGVAKGWGTEWFERLQFLLSMRHEVLVHICILTVANMWTIRSLLFR